MTHNSKNTVRVPDVKLNRTPLSLLLEVRVLLWSKQLLWGSEELCVLFTLQYMTSVMLHSLVWSYLLLQTWLVWDVELQSAGASQVTFNIVVVWLFSNFPSWSSSDHPLWKMNRDFMCKKHFWILLWDWVPSVATISSEIKEKHLLYRLSNIFSYE